MAEKVIHEVRFIETDDGFRVEVKGDKERMRRMGFGPGFGFGRGFRHAHRHGWRHFGPWWFCEDVEEDEAPSKDK